MTVSYQALKVLRPASLHQASTALSTAVTKLATEHTQYTTRVVDPLKARRGWHGGGQPDAAAVAEVNGLAIDTTRLRAAAGAAAYTYAFAGFTVAQVYLTALEKVKDGGMRITELGSVVDDHDPNSVQRTRCQVQLQKILDYATKVDGHASHTLNKSHEPPVTTLTNRPGLLDQARAGNADASTDARDAVDLLKTLGDDVRDLPDLRDELYRMPGIQPYHVDVPADTPWLGILGAWLLGGGLGTVAWSGGPGCLALATATRGTGGLVCAAGGVGGATLAGVGAILLTAAGVDVTQLKISKATDPRAADRGAGTSGSNNLDDLMKQARQVENQAKPDYGGNGLKGFNGKQPWTDKHGFRTNGKWTINGQQAKHLDGTPGKTQFSINRQEADDVVLDAASYADRHDLWDGSKAKVYVGRPVSYDADGDPIEWVNVYRTVRGSVHGCPGNPP